ncbi:hypothetical protein KC19_2G200100 [Ceratodon purpureus]|uniref:Uncharacterized protein n=1 Tax=Ceratodon purpureus TaxID=3225 RepID=A0A8T0IXJ7_CERPU|nr:hypothetical protein KC19_2G200100 [Ceratodon purpureus]
MGLRVEAWFSRSRPGSQRELNHQSASSLLDACAVPLASRSGALGSGSGIAEVTDSHQWSAFSLRYGCKG